MAKENANSPAKEVKKDLTNLADLAGGKKESEESKAIMKEGKVKWFDLERGYGFISPFGKGEDIFLHITDIQESGYETIEKGEFVEFEEKVGKNGKTRAKNITIFVYEYD